LKKINYFFILATILASSMLFTGCGMSALTPYGNISASADSQIFVYTDADVTAKAGAVRSDDTTLIIVGVKNSTGADLEKIFKHAMTKIEGIFKARQNVYKKWLDPG